MWGGGEVDLSNPPKGVDHSFPNTSFVALSCLQCLYFLRMCLFLSLHSAQCPSSELSRRGAQLLNLSYTGEIYPPHPAMNDTWEGAAVPTLWWEMTSAMCVHEGGRGGMQLYCTDKKKIKFSSYIRKFRMEQLQSHI
jgi:hypothetical protein